MKRWLKLSAALEAAPTLTRPKGKGHIGATPVWIDTFEGVDYYAKLIRKGLARVHAEADEKPTEGLPPAPLPIVESAPDPKPSPAAGKRSK